MKKLLTVILLFVNCVAWGMDTWKEKWSYSVDKANDVKTAIDTYRDKNAKIVEKINLHLLQNLKTAIFDLEELDKLCPEPNKIIRDSKTRSMLNKEKIQDFKNLILEINNCMNEEGKIKNVNNNTDQNNKKFTQEQVKTIFDQFTQKERVAFATTIVICEQLKQFELEQPKRKIINDKKVQLQEKYPKLTNENSLIQAVVFDAYIEYYQNIEEAKSDQAKIALIKAKFKPVKEALKLVSHPDKIKDERAKKLVEETVSKFLNDLNSSLQNNDKFRIFILKNKDIVEKFVISFLEKANNEFCNVIDKLKGKVDFLNDDATKSKVDDVNQIFLKHKQTLLAHSHCDLHSLINLLQIQDGIDDQVFDSLIAEKLVSGEIDFCKNAGSYYNKYKKALSKQPNNITIMSFKDWFAQYKTISDEYQKGCTLDWAQKLAAKEIKIKSIIDQSSGEQLNHYRQKQILALQKERSNIDSIEKLKIAVKKEVEDVQHYMQDFYAQYQHMAIILKKEYFSQDKYWPLKQNFESEQSKIDNSNFNQMLLLSNNTINMAIYKALAKKEIAIDGYEQYKYFMKLCGKKKELKRDQYNGYCAYFTNNSSCDSLKNKRANVQAWLNLYLFLDKKINLQTSDFSDFVVQREQRLNSEQLISLVDYYFVLYSRLHEAREELPDAMKASLKLLSFDSFFNEYRQIAQTNSHLDVRQICDNLYEKSCYLITNNFMQCYKESENVLSGLQTKQKNLITQIGNVQSTFSDYIFIAHNNDKTALSFSDWLTTQPQLLEEKITETQAFENSPSIKRLRKQEQDNIRTGKKPDQYNQYLIRENSKIYAQIHANWSVLSPLSLFMRPNHQSAVDLANLFVHNNIDNVNMMKHIQNTYLGMTGEKPYLHAATEVNEQQHQWLHLFWKLDKYLISKKSASLESYVKACSQEDQYIVTTCPTLPVNLRHAAADLLVRSKLHTKNDVVNKIPLPFGFKNAHEESQNKHDALQLSVMKYLSNINNTLISKEYGGPLTKEDTEKVEKEKSDIASKSSQALQYYSQFRHMYAMHSLHYIAPILSFNQWQKNYNNFVTNFEDKKASSTEFSNKYAKAIHELAHQAVLHAFVMGNDANAQQDLINGDPKEIHSKDALSKRILENKSWQWGQQKNQFQLNLAQVLVKNPIEQLMNFINQGIIQQGLTKQITRYSGIEHDEYIQTKDGPISWNLYYARRAAESNNSNLAKFYLKNWTKQT